MKAMWMLFVVASISLTNCHSVPHFESGGGSLWNNSHVHYGIIFDKARALRCVTNSINCCNDSDVGNWRDERGTVVHQGADGATCLYVTRGQGVVSLNRKDDCIPDTSGLWGCNVPDSNELMQSIYIYINNDTTSGEPLL